MPATRATTMQQRKEIMRLRQSGKTYHQIAQQLQLSYWVVRKWARRAHQAGIAGLVAPQGRPATGPLRTFSPLVRYVALRLKLAHPAWGASYIHKKMSQRRSLVNQTLPHPVAIWRYWRSFGQRLGRSRPHAAPRRRAGQEAHAIWQLDGKESVPIAGVGRVTILHARDEYSRVQVMHQVQGATSTTSRKVSVPTAALQQACRLAFARWGLPHAIQTDHARLFAGDEQTPFPTRLSLWWTGLGILHLFTPLNSPQRNGTVERSHRTLVERTLHDQTFANLAHLHQGIDADWAELNAECPSRATGPERLPPLVAHPEALTPRRPYRPEWELELFDLARVDGYLTNLSWLRRVSKVGQVNLGGYRYGVGMPFATQAVSIHFDPAERHMVFTQVRPPTARGRHLPELAPVRRPAQGLSRAELTGLPTLFDQLPPRQLMLPFELCYPLISQAA